MMMMMTAMVISKAKKETAVVKSGNDLGIEDDQGNEKK